MKFSGYWPVLLIVSLFYIKCIQTTDEFETESSDSNFLLPRAKFQYKTTAEHLDQKSMVGWYKMVNGFISAIHSKSAETVDLIMSYYLRPKTLVVPQSIYALLKLHYALIACVVIGLLYIVVMWITGLIVFCCRCCCNNCGGKRVQDQTRTTSLWRKILILFLLILIVLLLIAVICMFVTHNSLSTNYSTSEKKTDIVFEDMQSMLYNTKIQLSYIAFNCTKETFQAVFSILSGTEEFLEKEITEKMSPLENLTNSAELVASGVSNFTDILYAINNAGDRIFNNSELIKQGLRHIKEELEKLKENCTSDKCKQINPDQFSIDLNFQNVFIKNALDSFSKLNSTEFESSLQNVTKIIERLPKEISVQTKSLQNEIKSGLSKAAKELNDSATKLMSDIFPKTEETLYNASIRTKQYMQSGKKYDSYGKYTTLGICIIMTVIVSFLVIGLFFGICGYQNSRPPTKRTTMSNVGGHFLLISVTWMFIFSGIFMLFTIILFLFGSITDTYVCQPLYDKKLIMVNKILENIMNNTKTKIKIPHIGEIAPGDIISKCNSNETIFTIFDLENRLNLSEKLDFEKKLNAEKLIQELKDNITFPKIKLINDETETFLNNTIEVLKLEDITNGIESYNESKTINIDEQLKILKKLTDTEKELKSEIDAILNSSESILRNLIQFNEGKEELLKNLEKIVIRGKVHLEHIMQLYDIMKFQDQYLEKNLTKNIIEIANKFVLLLKVPGDKLVEFIRKSLTESIVPCKPFWNIFATARILLCEYYIQVLNGFWFALGWCLFCFIPTIIVAFKLTKHFLRMTELGKPDEYKKEKPEYELELIDEDSSSRSWVTQRNKIRPDNGWHPPVQHM